MADVSPTATMQTGDVVRRLGPVTGDLLKELGFRPLESGGRAQLWKQSDWPEICRKVGEYYAGRVDAPMVDKPTAKPKNTTSAPPPPPAKARRYIQDDDL